MPNLEKSNSKLRIAKLTTPSPQDLAGTIKKEGGSIPVKPKGSIISGPLTSRPPSLKEWKASGNRGFPPVAYETVIKDVPNNALEYELYHGFKGQVSQQEIEQRIQQLEKGLKTQHQRYTRSALYYLRKKLEEYVVGD